jgi:hypothetical protein
MAGAVAPERRAAGPVTVGSAASLAKRARRAYLRSVWLGILALGATMLVDGGWQAVASALSVAAGLVAVFALIVAVTLADHV